MAIDVLIDGLAAGHFLALDHTRKWAREEFFFPGPSIDRVEGVHWQKSDKQSAVMRAHKEVQRILATAEPPPLDNKIKIELERLASVS